jgi:DNA-binding NtrC family response regulator
MNKSGPIIIIEDDLDDREVLVEIFKNQNYDNEIVYMEDGEKAFEYLAKSSVEPFIILSDINMPKLNGMALRDKIHNNEELRLKCTPYLFFTTTGNQETVVDAYSKSVQGFFIKPKTFERFESTIKRIVEYWQECISPNYISNRI